MHLATRTAHASTTVGKEMQDHMNDDSSLSPCPKDVSSSTTASTPCTSISTAIEPKRNFEKVNKWIALGCIHYDHAICIQYGSRVENDWLELIYSELPEETILLLGNEASRLLDARWIRLFVHQPECALKCNRALLRVYLMPEDWGRRSIDRSSKTLKTALRQLLQQIDTSPGPWTGDTSEAETTPFDPWANSDPVSLYYLFNKLPSPAPNPTSIKSRYTRATAQDLLNSVAYSEWEDHGEQPLAGLRTRLYPYQARSAALMLQREASPQLQLDPRLEIRTSPDGETFFFAPRDGSFLQEPQYYEANRGGILAESMGLGKTLICLSVILATKGHLPQVPAAHHPPPTVRDRVGRLSDMAAAIMGRNAIPAKAYIEQSEANGAGDLTRLKDALNRNIPFYEIPQHLPKKVRNSRIPPPKQLVLASGTIIVVPRNLLHQWQSEIRKHVLKGGLKILVVDSVSKRGSKSKVTLPEDDIMKFESELPAPTELMNFDVILFTRNRFEQEIQDGQDNEGRRATSGMNRVCNCPYIGSTRLPNCNCFNSDKTYESPLKKLHWLRIIIDEGHNFSSSVSNAVLVAKQIQAERRWVVSGTPAKNLVGVELDISTLDPAGDDPSSLRDLAIEQRKSFSLDIENTKAVKALGSLASNFLMVRPWCDTGMEGKLEWDEYMYRHEHPYRKTYTGFSSCFLRTLEGLVVKTRPDDVEKDIVLPPMRHRIVYLQPCWFDKMTANLFIQVLRANAITSERTDIDYLFHKNSLKARHSLIKNLRQSNFTWTGFSLDDVISTLETSSKYLSKEDKKCSPADVQALLESSQVISTLTSSEAWIALSKAHEVGMAVQDWPKATVESFALTHLTNPALISITQLVAGQLHVDSNILSENPVTGLEAVGRTTRARVATMAIEEEKAKIKDEGTSTDLAVQNTSVPSSCIGKQSPVTNRRASVITSKFAPERSDDTQTGSATHNPTAKSPARSRKRKLTLAEETALLDANSPLSNTRVVGTTSAKLTYLLDKVMQHQASEKIIIFYDGDDAAFYIAQCLEMLYVNHRIYARTLENVTRSEYVRLFNEDADVRVLLIDVACGALGLNLNAASVVLIVNPINRPFLEAQAVKRAHRIGQTREVLVETLVLENTIEHAIFNRARNMSRTDHQEAKELEDDASIIEIIQNAKILPVTAAESETSGSYALLKSPQQVFGRPDRHKYHRYGFVDADKGSRQEKKPKTTKASRKTSGSQAGDTGVYTPANLEPPHPVRSNVQGSETTSQLEILNNPASVPSIFGRAG